MELLLLVGVLVFVAIIIAPPNPKPEMTKEELKHGCNMSLVGLVLTILALIIMAALVMPLAS